MKILITGATGLIGGEIVRLCKEQSIPVNYLTTSKDKLVSEPNYRGFYWNPEVGEIDTDCFKGVSAIVNLAGASISKRWTADYKKKILSSRINALRTLNEALEKVGSNNITSFVAASAIGIYQHSMTEFYTEDEKEIEPGFLGEVVAAWEKEIASFKKHDFNLSIVRIGLVLSKKGGALVEMAKPIRYYAGAAFGSGNQWQSWIHISDLAGIFLFAIQANLNGIYNGVAPNPVTNSKMVKEIAKVLGKPVVLPNIPEFVMKAVLGEMAHLLFASQRVSSKKIEQKGFAFQYQNICQALEHIYSTATNE